jgi:hypothetical protein
LQVTADEAGLSTIEASGPGGAGGVFSVRVVPGAPASAEFAAATFGGVSPGGTVTLELLVLDAAGNENHNISEITGVSLSSSDNGIATVAAAIVDTLADSTERQIFVTVTGVAGGAVNVSGSVTTTAGVLAVGATPATVLEPIIASTVLASGAGATVSITGSSLSATGFVTQVLVDGSPLGNITVVSANQIDAQMPTLLDGTYDVEVSVGGVASNTGSWTQAGGFDEDEAANDDPGTAPTISAPFEFNGSFEGAPEEDDFFVFTLSADATLVIDLNWTPAKDLDILVTDVGVTTAFCTDGATGARPEQSVCELTAGTYILWLNDFDAADNGNATPVTYTVTGRIQ